MCHTVHINGVECTTVGELRKELRRMLFIYPTYEDPVSDDQCLCAVDLPMTLRWAGVVWEEDIFGDCFVTMPGNES